MKKYDLSRKKPSALEKTRKLAEQNPNTIYGYFDLIQEEASRLNILQRPECFWNLDETNLCLDPSRTKVIAPKGKRASRITATSGREHVTVLAAVSAQLETNSLLLLSLKESTSFKTGTHRPLIQVLRSLDLSQAGWQLKSLQPGSIDSATTSPSVL